MKKLIVCLLFISCENKMEISKRLKPIIVKDNSRVIQTPSKPIKTKNKKKYYRYRRN